MSIPTTAYNAIRNQMQSTLALPGSYWLGYCNTGLYTPDELDALLPSLSITLGTATQNTTVVLAP